MGTVEVVLDNQRDIRDIICDVMTGPVEGGVVGDDDCHVYGGQNDHDVPETLEVAVVREHKLWFLGDCSFIFW